MNEDIEEYIEWKKRLGEEDMIHAFRAIKTLTNIKFIIATAPDEDEQISAIRGEASKWIS